MLLEFRHRETGLSVVVDDDGRVAYAYLRDPDEQIIGDVWLYNRGESPTVGDWSDPSKAPFPNPLSHARPIDVPPRVAEELSIRWTVDEELFLADVMLRGRMLARLSPGSAPGWNVLAEVDGPCAQCFAPEDLEGDS